jgi:hypothetical protein
MGLFRLIFIFLIGYFIFKVIKRILQPGQPNQHVHGKSKKPDHYQNKNNIQDIDYEELD